MEFNFLEFLLGNFEAAGAIGGYVAISIIGFAFISFATRNKIKGNSQIGPKWAHPIIGAALGIIPGCGATIIASSLYKNKKISFGGLFATFIATLGEGSFVLLGASDEADVAANLTAFVVVNIVGFIVGTILGYVVDAIGIRKVSLEVKESTKELTSEDLKVSNPIAHAFIEKVGFYIMLAIAVYLLPGSIMALWGGGISAIEGMTVWIATFSTAFSLVYYLVYRYAYNRHCCVNKDSIKHTLISAIIEVSMVVFFVFIGLFVANYLIDVIIGPERFDSWMTSEAFAVVIIAAIIGATPGCGGMIAVAVAYTTIPNFPMPALIAAAIATSGDGIFPLLASNRKDAILITAAGLVTAIVVGYATLALGI